MKFLFKKNIFLTLVIGPRTTSYTGRTNEMSLHSLCGQTKLIRMSLRYITGCNSHFFYIYLIITSKFICFKKLNYHPLKNIYPNIYTNGCVSGCVYFCIGW